MQTCRRYYNFILLTVAFNCEPEMLDCQIPCSQWERTIIPELMRDNVHPFTHIWGEASMPMQVIDDLIQSVSHEHLRRRVTWRLECFIPPLDQRIWFHEFSMGLEGTPRRFKLLPEYERFADVRRIQSIQRLQFRPVFHEVDPTGEAAYQFTYNSERYDEPRIVTLETFRQLINGDGSRALKKIYYVVRI